MNDESSPKSGAGNISHAAESTQFRALGHFPDPDVVRESPRPTDPLHGSMKSIRLHAPRSTQAGLAFKLAAPIVTVMVVGLVVAALFAREHLFDVHLRDLKSDAASAAFLSGVFGRVYLSQREKFLAANPDYPTSEEWRTGDHWLIAKELVEPEEWVRATGFELNEYAPASALDRAEKSVILGNLTQWLNATGSSSELTAIYLLDANGKLLASSENERFKFNAAILKSKPLPLAFIEAGGSRVLTDYVADFEPEPLIRGVSRIMEGDRRIGTTVAVIRSARMISEVRAFFYLGLASTAVIACLIGFVSWYSARRITVPLRQLISDMHAMAEGDYSRRSTPSGTAELSLLGQAFNSMAERLRVALENEKENTRLERDLDVAREIQYNLLPPQTPRVRGFDIHCSYRPAKEIGGDYFDFLPVDDHHMGITIADASGKSIPAALVMSTTRAILRFVAPGSISAAETLTRVNAVLSVDIPVGIFVTAFYLILDPVARTMTCASAGHTPLLIARTDGTVEIVNPGGIALGFDRGTIFERSIREQRVQLAEGDRVLLYTDGVVECVNPANEEYSDRRLREFLRRNRELSSHDFIGALLADLDRHRGVADMRDDTTIVTFMVL